MYASRAASASARALFLDRRCLVLGLARLAIGLAVAAFAIQTGLAWSWLIAAVASFFALTMIQDTLIRRRDGQRRIASLNERELAALRGERPFGPGFDAPPDADHRYADDLEIFYEHGLYRFVNRALTSMGRRALAGWLSRPAMPDEILARQIAARELEEQIEHRQTLAAAALVGGDGAAHPRLGGDMPAPLPAAAALGLPVLTLGTGLASCFIAPFLSAFLTLVAVQAVLCGVFGRRIGRVLREASGTARTLGAYAAMLEAVEAYPALCARLQALKARLSSDELPASTAIRRLGTLLEWMEVRNAPILHIPLNLLLLWDLNGARALSAWLRRFGPSITPWLETLGEWEALSSLATIAFNNPDWAWPKVGAAGVRAEGLGHPLIPERERVLADIVLPADGIWIVTGPNMAGKSTFLRTVGVGLVMAQAGAPVCARRFELPSLELITSMRISDSLDKKMSLFYAELQRLKQILDAVGAREAVFFLIDEMLKGTNTLDRQAGALALVRQLRRARVPGIVATHDLAIAELAGEDPASIANFHFDGTVEGDRLVFDYRLRQGACERFNALSLMRAVGIKLDPDEAENAPSPPRERPGPSGPGLVGS